jgi:hypothetical protein
MITCPFCGTTYTQYQSTCKQCGAPLPRPPDPPAVPAFPGIEILSGPELQALSELAQPARPEPPPSPPRPISSSYILRIMAAEAWGIIGLVFALIGTIFACVALSVFTTQSGVPLIFGGIGLVMGGGGWALLVWQAQRARKVVETLRTGDTAEGQITEVTQDYSTTINGAHPWIIRYRFNANGAAQNGEVQGPLFSALKFVGRWSLKDCHPWLHHLFGNMKTCLRRLRISYRKPLQQLIHRHIEEVDFTTGPQLLRSSPIVFAFFACPEAEIEDDIRSQFKGPTGYRPQQGLNESMPGIMLRSLSILTEEPDMPFIGG